MTTEPRTEGEKIRNLEMRLTAIEIEGSPNIRERVARLESTVSHLTDPQTGVYPMISQNYSQLLRWAIALLTALVGAIILLLIHITTSGGF